jgi:hypothetical protein
VSAAERKEPTEALDQLLAIAPAIMREPSAWRVSRIVQLLPGAGRLSPGLVTSAALRKAVREAWLKEAADAAAGVAAVGVEYPANRRGALGDAGKHLEVTMREQRKKGEPK